MLSIMIHEDFNRPLFARVVEGIIGASSKGVMQFKGARNDVESINSAIKFVRKESRKVPASTIDNYELMLASAVVNIAQKYNPHDKNYPYQVLEIFEKISN